MHPLLTASYWFSITPVPFLPWAERLLLVVFSAFLLVGIIAWVVEMRAGYSKLVKRALDRAASLFAWSGVFGLLLWVFAYERVPVLSMRFFYVVWIVAVLIGCWSIYRFVWFEIPSVQERQRERVEREKWLPKKR